MISFLTGERQWGEFDLKQEPRLVFPISYIIAKYRRGE